MYWSVNIAVYMTSFSLCLQQAPSSQISKNQGIIDSLVFLMRIIWPVLMLVRALHWKLQKFSSIDLISPKKRDWFTWLQSSVISSTVRSEVSKTLTGLYLCIFALFFSFVFRRLHSLATPSPQSLFSDGFSKTSVLSGISAVPIGQIWGTCPTQVVGPVLPQGKINKTSVMRREYG